MTVQPISPTDPLSDPSHAGEHNTLSGQVRDLGLDLGTLTGRVDALDPQVQQARLAAHMWVVRDALPAVVDPPVLLLPIVWNLTGHAVQYVAAKAAVYAPPVGANIVIDIVTGTTLEGGVLDTASMTTILSAPLEITDGTYTSASFGVDDFVGEMSDGSFLAAVVQQVGSTSPGADLTIQLNRLL